MMRRVKEEDKPCEARTDGLPCDFQEDGHKSVFVCRYCGRVGQRILSTSQGKVFEHDDEKNLRADKGKTTDPLTTVVSSSVYTSNTSNLAAGLTARDRTISFTKRVCVVAAPRRRGKTHSLCCCCSCAFFFILLFVVCADNNNNNNNNDRNQKRKRTWKSTGTCCRSSV